MENQFKTLVLMKELHFIRGKEILSLIPEEEGYNLGQLLVKVTLGMGILGLATTHVQALTLGRATQAMPQAVALNTRKIVICSVIIVITLVIRAIAITSCMYILQILDKTQRSLTPTHLHHQDMTMLLSLLVNMILHQIWMDMQVTLVMRWVQLHLII